MAIILDIDHEANNFSEWDGTVTDGGDLSVAGAAALAGTAYGMQAVMDDDNDIYGYVGFAGLSNLRYRDYVDPNAVVHNDGYVCLASIFNGTGQECAAIYLGPPGASAYKIELWVANDSGSYTNPAAADVTDAPHYVEIRLNAGTGANGIAHLWVDGVDIGGVTNLNTDTRWASMEELRVGAFDVSAFRGTIYRDQIVLTDTDDVAIGPHVSQSQAPRSVHQYRIRRAQ